MSHRSAYQSGPDDDDQSQIVDYEEEGQQLTEIDADDSGLSDLERNARRRGCKDASSSSKAVNTVKQSVSNARAAAASTAAVDNPSSSNENAAEGLDLKLYTLVKRYDRKLKGLDKRERELNEAASSQSSKRQKASTNSKRSSESSDSSGSSNDDDNDHHITSNGKGMDLTLRQDAIVKKFPTLTYVDVIVFSRVNLNVRKSKRLVPISSSAEFNAAWSSLNVELQQYLINADRSDDALMVTKYYGQIVRLLTDYSSQWQLVMELDGYIRGNPPVVGGRTVWSVDSDDDHVSQFRYDIRAKHQDAFRANAALSNPRSSASQPRRAGAAASNSNSSNKPRSLCYAYNGWNTATSEWQSISHCRGADRCRFAHKCIHCKADGHAIYERPECASHPRVFPTRNPPSRR